MKNTIFGIIVLAGNLLNTAYAQKEQDVTPQKEQAINKYTSEYQAAQLPIFFEKEPPVGTLYFTEYWMRGAAEFTNHQTIPTKEKHCYFNFDKTKNILIVVDDSLHVNYYHGNEVSQFMLMDSSDKTYRFEIVPAISQTFYLQPVVETNLRYSLYKRLVTKLAAADYQSYGYGSTGAKHDTYTDYYEYYLLYPDHQTFKKFYMDAPALRKVFSVCSNQLEPLLNQYKNRLNEESLINLVECINKTY
jgi:hypothetical protein